MVPMIYMMISAAPSGLTLMEPKSLGLTPQATIGRRSAALMLLPVPNDLSPVSFAEILSAMVMHMVSLLNHPVLGASA